ncbi:hypothetical protein SAMN05421823_112124 [Catalinimonas alkaloidigena]|uniref:IPT/TIG domain-containing protein n=1 Tax=Catalinimonas alkaloidigena TaxID=1075417 RepID=A0A1G9SDG9_9BACT|nr:IPT/TIG domain-containing protein [Catalinimonas alkaloidigena]SDM33523.1 hypothetical protein SAMN05421823_112124 [Catalinimonas alkaloidigena]
MKRVCRPPFLLRGLCLLAGFGWLIGCAGIFDLPEPLAPPRVVSLMPDSGAAGTTVVIGGEQFSTQPDLNLVRFNGKVATLLAATATQLTVVVPEHAGSGPVEVVVGPKATDGPLFTFFERPVIQRIEPTQGAPGSWVTLYGQYFDTIAAQNTVAFGGQIGTVDSLATDTLLRVAVPADAATGPVSVTVHGITGIGPQFTVLSSSLDSAHTVISIDPTHGSADTVVTITGKNFRPVPDENLVQFNGTPAPVLTATSTQLTARAPAGGTTGRVSVTIDGKTANGPVFTYEDDTPLLTISHYDPIAGSVGDGITIVGTNFDPEPAKNLVRFNGTAATVQEASLTLLRAVVPPGATTGPISVTVGTQTATGPEFTVVDEALTLTSFAPTNGPVGTTVTLTGTGFGSDTNALHVAFNGVVASVTSVQPTTLTTTVPQGATTGKIAVTVGSQTVYSTSDFTVIVPRQWVYTGSMNQGRSEHTATLLANGKVLVTGGYGIQDNTSVTLTSCELYDPATGQWTTTGSLVEARFRHQATLLADGRVLVTGGKDYPAGALYSCELYDPATGQWSVAAHMLQNRVLHKAILLENGNVLVVGGSNEAYYGVQSTCELYDPTTDSWTATGYLPQAKIGFGLSRLLDGRVLATAGETNGYNGFTGTCFLFDPATGQWTATGSLASVRSSCQTFTQPNGKVLVIGGSGGANISVYGCELYDPNQGTWSPSLSLLSGRYQAFASAMFPDGSVLVTGGVNSGNAVELISLKSEFSLNEPGMLQVRAAHTATVLPDGKVLVTGGGYVDRSCEVFTP